MPFASASPLKPTPDTYLNLIHVEDAAETVCAAAAGTPATIDVGPELFLVADGHPVLRRHYYGFVAEQIGAAAPTFTRPSDGSARARRRIEQQTDFQRKAREAATSDVPFPDVPGRPDG